MYNHMSRAEFPSKAVQPVKLANIHCNIIHLHWSRWRGKKEREWVMGRKVGEEMRDGRRRMG